MLFKHKTGDAFSEIKQTCDGSNALIFARKTCEVPVANFISTDYPFRLIAGDIVHVKVAAHNKNGWGDFSDINTNGAVVESVPVKMAKPTRNVATNTLQIVVDWLPPSNDGYNDIVSYNV